MDKQSDAQTKWLYHYRTVHSFARGSAIKVVNNSRAAEQAAMSVSRIPAFKQSCFSASICFCMTGQIHTTFQYTVELLRP